MIATAPARPATPMAILPAARAFCLAWSGMVFALLIVQWVHELPRISTAVALVGALGLVACSRPVRLGASLELSAAHPITFVALLMWGTSTAALIGGCCALGATLLRRPGLGILRQVFNLAMGVGVVIAAGWVFELTGPGAGTAVLDSSTVIALFYATAVAFPLSTMPVAVAVSLQSRRSPWTLWSGRYLPTAPGMLAASGLALLLTAAVQQFGPASLLFYIPLATLVFTRLLLPRRI